LFVNFTLFLARVFVANLFVGLFLRDVDLLPLDLLRDLADEIAFFISQSLPVWFEEVKGIFA